jgi:hypothetical protein
MSVVIFNSFTQASLADIPIHAKLTIPLCLLVFSLISCFMLPKFQGYVNLFPSLMTIAATVLVVEKHVLMDKEFRFAYP